MTPNPIDTEHDRLASVCDLGILDTPPEDQYDGLVRLAATICGTPIALVTIVDSQRQWFKARFGLEATETTREISFCGHAIHSTELFVVPDATADTRFRDNPLVTGEPHIRFYAGFPLADGSGHNLGTLCVIDRTPRHLGEHQRDALRILANQVQILFQARRQVRQLRAAQAALDAEQERFKLFMDNGPAVAFIKDDYGRFVYVNAPLVRRFGIPADQWLGRTDADLWPEDVARAVQETDRHVLAIGQPVTVYETVPTRDGTAYHWQSYKFPITDMTGRQFVGGMAVDRTVEHEAELTLQASEEKFRRVVDGLAECVLLLDADTKMVLDSNAAAAELFGYTAAELRTKTLFELSTHPRPSIEANLARVVSLGRLAIGRRKYLNRDGSVLDLDMSASVVTHGGQNVVAAVFRDVGAQILAEEQLHAYQKELERANETLRLTSVTDGLTGIRNRAAFSARLDEEFDRAKRYGRPLSVILLDVDHFKAFNDTFGHPAGDETLKAVAQELAAAARSTDTVARYGGEEFGIVLSDTDIAGAMVLAERCRRGVAGRDWPLRQVTVSVGVSTLSDATSSASQLLTEADEALYQSKRAGRDRVNHGSGIYRLPGRTATC